MRSSLTLIGFSVLTDVTLTLVLIKSQSELISVPLRQKWKWTLSVLSSSRNNWLTRAWELRTFYRKLQDNVHTFFSSVRDKVCRTWPSLDKLNWLIKWKNLSPVSSLSHSYYSCLVLPLKALNKETDKILYFSY